MTSTIIICWRRATSAPSRILGGRGGPAIVVVPTAAASVVGVSEEGSIGTAAVGPTVPPSAEPSVITTSTAIPSVAPTLWVAVPGLGGSPVVTVRAAAIVVSVTASTTAIVVSVTASASPTSVVVVAAITPRTSAVIVLVTAVPAAAVVIAVTGRPVTRVGPLVYVPFSGGPSEVAAVVAAVAPAVAPTVAAVPTFTPNTSVATIQVLLPGIRRSGPLSKRHAHLAPVDLLAVHLVHGFLREKEVMAGGQVARWIVQLTEARTAGGWLLLVCICAWTYNRVTTDDDDCAVCLCVCSCSVPKESAASPRWRCRATEPDNGDSLASSRDRRVEQSVLRKLCCC